MFGKVSSWPRADYFARPERREGRKTFIDRLAWEMAGYVVRPWSGRTVRLNRILGYTEQAAQGLDALSDGELRERSVPLKRRLRVEGFSLPLVGESFALVREASSRIMGLRHFDCQLMGGYAILKGLLAEMETGEGKTLVATLPAATAALAGIPVHVITVNDYLTDRDAGLMGALYRFFGLTVGCVIHDMTPPLRRAAYGCDITYCTNKEVVFDYLRDRITLGDSAGELQLHAEHLARRSGRSDGLLLRGLHFAIVDEADSVLVDEARTPLIISRTESSADEERALTQALDVAGDLQEGIHYRIHYEADQGLRAIIVTDRGRETVQEITAAMGTIWRSPIRREELVRKALTALYLYRRDEHYLVQDGKVQIIDEFTGRVMPDRAWEGGLHQLIEAKEGCEVTGQRETVARISYQRFFRRYLKLSGMTGTAREVRRELWSTYGLPVVRVPTNRPLKRKVARDEVFRTLDEKYDRVARRVEELNRREVPVLIGTRTVAASEHLAGLLRDRGIPLQVLNAKQDREEALIVARAGEPGRVTIATNMAGRGTDIKLAPGMVDLGGLHVLMTERHEAGRIDRQLAGRCGRQGEPGRCETFISLEDPLLKDGRRGVTEWAVRQFGRGGTGLWRPLGRRAMHRAQKRVERVHAAVRRRLLRYDEERSDTLSFSGKSE